MRYFFLLAFSFRFILSNLSIFYRSSIVEKFFSLTETTFISWEFVLYIQSFCLYEYREKHYKAKSSKQCERKSKKKKKEDKTSNNNNKMFQQKLEHIGNENLLPKNIL